MSSNLLHHYDPTERKLYLMSKAATPDCILHTVQNDPDNALFALNHPLADDRIIDHVVQLPLEDDHHRALWDTIWPKLTSNVDLINVLKEKLEPLSISDDPWAQDKLAQLTANVLQRNEKDLKEITDPVREYLNYSEHQERAFSAAEFLANKTITQDQKDQALRDSDGSIEAAALLAVGMDPDDVASLEALRAIVKISELQRSEDEPVQAIAVVPAKDEGLATALIINNAFHTGNVSRIKLNGKHSQGSLLALDPNTGYQWLLKPGSGKQIPALGVREESASQSEREVAFGEVAELLGLGGSLPHSDLLLIDAHQYAAISIFSHKFKNLDKVRKENEPFVRESMYKYIQSGMVHKWAIMDYILGQPDRHANNILINDKGVIKLIDQGSAMAGYQFDPPNDKNCFVPYYLRIWAGKGFSKLDPEAKLKIMPRINPEIEGLIRKWFESIPIEKIASILHRYNVSVGPALSRIKKIEEMIKMMEIDLAIDTLWTVPLQK